MSERDTIVFCYNEHFEFTLLQLFYNLIITGWRGTKAWIASVDKRETGKNQKK